MKSGRAHSGRVFIHQKPPFISLSIKKLITKTIGCITDQLVPVKECNTSCCTVYI